MDTHMITLMKAHAAAFNARQSLAYDFVKDSKDNADLKTAMLYERQCLARLESYQDQLLRDLETKLTDIHNRRVQMPWSSYTKRREAKRIYRALLNEERTASEALLTVQKLIGHRQIGRRQSPSVPHIGA